MSKENLNFKSDTKKILDLVTNSLYSEKDIFIREIISNSSDAIEKRRMKSLTDTNMSQEKYTPKIKIAIDKPNKTISISDNGIGMTKDEVIKNLGTIAKSGTKSFIENINKNKDSGLIGQFGVGFYSSFIVADKVVVITKSIDSKQGIKWESEGTDSYAIEDFDKHEYGTEVILYLKDNKDIHEYLNDYKIKELIKSYSDFIQHPITMDIEKEEKAKDKDGKEIKDAKPIKTIEEQTLNSMKAIWLKSPKDVTKEEYKNFLSHISMDNSDPTEIIHYKVEGTTEFSALIYIPSTKPWNIMTKEKVNNNIHLYINRVFILKNSEALLPEYLRFISGVVDSSDLPLNISREILQKNRITETIKKSLVKKTLSKLSDLKKKDTEKYIKFYKEFGVFLKEGIYSDFENKDTLIDLILFKSSKTKGEDEFVSLKEYTERNDKKNIYYITGESLEDVKDHAHLEIFKAKDIEVLYFIDPIDELVMQTVGNYKDRNLKSILKGDLNLDDNNSSKKDKKGNEDNKDNNKEIKQDDSYKDLIAYMKDQLKSKVSDIKISERLVSSACCLVRDGSSISESMEKMMKMYNQNIPEAKYILEINKDSDLVKKINSIFKSSENKEEDNKLNDMIKVLYGLALSLEGSKISTPVDFAKSIERLLV